ncbi:hypothetical protein A3J90_02520 [candidate division WOR-1 bacterium RIFOXYC2_FULL_37_10]|uniref:Dipeptidylpeptidase IV N-terminal domain-containing protein n=1 Tax=candidate division WOR-1 bacterium RIFOXYB2_FULL_37_13 TaxID=1802579 RepID=A0A1F4SUJ1_UNCSA|nr:MAG: hypothetical protein A2246_06890 [candidate division WOR-1 bacterium RIFOXYA2_FULL_37_7]OGC24099.1 MAG: hypothetical protein A2310_05120 [candidate division WOR-1 bacterium RIFOXYB2_FULL_37_13]OGC32731.1 MAG: hypothetical protein A3J90_02520 [candidate division WOR-1 bacterium RIFOXYC2_FULL_37_10]
MGKKVWFLILVLVAFSFSMMGCSSLYDEAWYQAPNWTPEGLIYFQKSITHYRQEPMGTITLGTDYEYWTMTVDGTQETKLPYTSYPYYSPKGTYVAMISGSNLNIVRRSDNQTVYSYAFPIAYGGSLDWGPDDDKLVYQKASSGTLITMNIDGSNPIEITSKEVMPDIAWKYNSMIACIGDYLTLVSSDGVTSEVLLSDVPLTFYPNYYSDGKYLFTADTNKFYKIDLNSKDVVSAVSHQLNSFKPQKVWINPKLSPDNQKVIGGFSLDTGIWITNIDGTGLKQLK